MFKIYCDGACSNNGAKNAIGGYGFIILGNKNRIVQTGNNFFYGTTNQRMELQAALSALDLYKHLFDTEVKVFTDSAYLCNCQREMWWEKWENNNWKNSKKKPVANRDLWEQLIPYFKDYNIKFFKVKGHDGDKWNEYVDDIATTSVKKGRDNYQQNKTKIYKHLLNESLNKFKTNKQDYETLVSVLDKSKYYVETFYNDLLQKEFVCIADIYNPRVFTLRNDNDFYILDVPDSDELLTPKRKINIKVDSWKDIQDIIDFTTKENEKQ
jgi:ribonuclease HI